MNRFSDLQKTYDASSVEDRIYANWEKSGVFNPDQLPERNQAGDPYCITMPPPNRTGTLHMGHATMLAIEDLLIRFQRMQGKRTLWIPGTDHAAIATQVKVEQLLMKQGMKNPREFLGREKFLEEVVKFAEESKNTINKQVRKMGCSCDWSRERYTLDTERSRAVTHMFKMMFDDGVIERGYRIVNWDPQFQTTLSDDEVLIQETKAKLLTFTYDADFPIAISTTRPETKFGDKAVAVHPDDTRYKDFIGKTFHPVFCGKTLTIKIIGDEAVDPAFGTGALGVTPAHSMIDADIAERHGLETTAVIGKDAHLLPEVGSDFVGLSILEAREKIEKHLRSAGVLLSVEDIMQNLPVAERGGAAVEQLPMEQWFIRVNKLFALRNDTLGKWKKGEMVSLKELMIEAVESGEINIVPERFNKIYFHWINHLRDWCISRQIWFGHRIPVWYRAQADTSVVEKEMMISETSPGEEWIQDPDTLDTWFSSGMWSFSTLGWPNKKMWEEHRDYHPNAVLETGYDILFFWVARMILMSTYALGEVPFKNVYLHGLVRDEQGRKMSKSLGNILDPLDLIPKYGTDAVRLSLVMGTTPGQDVRLSEAKIEGFRNFTNKLWNISRFILLQIGDADVTNPTPEINQTTFVDRWFLQRQREVIFSVTDKLSKYQFSSAAEELRDFTWNDLADWYLEISKIEKGKEMQLVWALHTLLRLWHPFMPFVTEYIWGLAGFKGDCITAVWPEGSHLPLRHSEYDAFRSLQEIISNMRRLRSEQGIEPAVKVEFALIADALSKDLVLNNTEIICVLARASSVHVVESFPAGWPSVVGTGVTIAVNALAMVDIEKEKEKIAKELTQLEAYVVLTEEKLQNEEFLSKAPEKVTQAMEKKLLEAQTKIQALVAKRTLLG
ncbi:valine--tRNA ligase [Candidatus Uhrbacteria bacterium]|nr:valine--tRNA ligase [Candidatus Uhrbacteria bacterium]